MVRGSRALFSSSLISNSLLDILVCPLSKQPLRLCQSSQSLVGDAIGVSFPIVDGIPCLVPKDGKFLEEMDKQKPDAGAEPSTYFNL
ncbi:uncharacterized protein LOC109837049 [Asparagus officinalis]|uniref:uncharacterized protein LOC109837049 n=1 Tax=Asparagus officinalis TaxID=4686 RepID=UPI00098E5864|nr:uncharacterized protein LOC109837049 [Asparagus officinalis]XP_020260721.1 uncharacterized protein LOC109837049 [Asparagus officinalis]XP_020260722.1 uncharacterized protein LOC109837049 [Asparagus officinalis]